jgi:prophage antirepressor-like protein
LNTITIFENKEFGEVRTIQLNNEVYFIGKDVAKALGYAKTENAISTHVDNEDKTTTLIQGTGSNYKSNAVCINESGVYALIFGSKLESAKRFKRWVTSEVLPQIRKTGGYIPVTKEDTDLQIMAKAYQIMLKTIEQKDALIESQSKELEQQTIELKQQEPFVNFAKTVSKSADTISMGVMAKLLNDEGINIGRNKLMAWLRKEKILMHNNVPYQQYVNRGLFEVCNITKQTAYGDKVYPTTYITGKGQIYIAEKLRREMN